MRVARNELEKNWAYSTLLRQIVKACVVNTYKTCPLRLSQIPAAVVKVIISSVVHFHLNLLDKFLLPYKKQLYFLKTTTTQHLLVSTTTVKEL